jgi:hypothetical protein
MGLFDYDPQKSNSSKSGSMFAHDPESKPNAQPKKKVDVSKWTGKGVTLNIEGRAHKPVPEAKPVKTPWIDNLVRSTYEDAVLPAVEFNIRAANTIVGHPALGGPVVQPTSKSSEIVKRSAQPITTDEVKSMPKDTAIGIYDAAKNTPQALKTGNLGPQLAAALQVLGVAVPAFKGAKALRNKIKGAIPKPTGVSAREAQVTPVESKSQARKTASGQVAEVPTNQILADPERFQFKANMGEGGAGAELRGVQKYDPELAGVVLVWEDPANGQTYVVNGHHRLELAKRTNQPSMLVRYIKAGTSTEARTKGALVNIAEGRGTPIDAAKLFKDTGMKPAELAQQGISLKGAVARDGLALSGLTDHLFTKVAKGEMPISRGATIARSVDTAAEQTALFKMLERNEKKGKRLNDREVEELARFVKSAGTSTSTTVSLFGDEAITQSLALEKAQLSAYIKDRLSKDKRLFGYVAKEERAAELSRGQNVINVEESGKIAKQAANAEEVYDRLSTMTGPLSDALNDAAGRLSKGENANAVKEGLYKQIHSAVSEIIGKTEEGSVGVAPDGGTVGRVETQAGTTETAVTPQFGQVPGTTRQAGLPGAEVPDDFQLTSPKFEEVEQAAAERVNAVIPEENLPMPGLSLRYTQQVPREPRKPGGTQHAFADPEIEARWQQASKGVTKGGFIGRTIQASQKIWNRATRTHEEIPRTGQYAEANEAFRLFSHQKSIAGSETARLLHDVTLDLDTPSYDLFTRKVIMDDLTESAARGEELPFGFDQNSLAAEKSRIDSAVDTNRPVVEALQKRANLQNAVKDDYIGAMKSIGWDASKKFTRDNYFHHQVLDYMEAKRIAGTGAKLKAPTGRGFLKKREGSAQDISTNYLQAEWEVLSQMRYDTAVANTIARIDKNYSITDRLKLQAEQLAQAGEAVDWRKLVPDGYKIWQPREGNTFYLADSIPKKLADQLAEGMIDELGLSADQLREVLAVGGRLKEMVIPEGIANTLDHLGERQKQGPVGELSSSILRRWKQYVLLNPRAAVKYNLRNLTGDMEAVFVGNPSALKYSKRAATELYPIFKQPRAPIGELREWMKRGGTQGLLQAQEMGDVSAIRLLSRRAQGEKPSVGEIVKENLPHKLPGKYGHGVRSATDFRESILRYASYLDYLEQMKQNNGKPRNFGRSKPEEVMALKDVRDRAYKLSNELVGAYDQVTEMGRDLRAHLAPFWSWNEINFGGTIRMFKNAAASDNVAGTIGRKMGVGIPRAAVGVGKLALKGSALWTALEVYNHTRFPDEEADLPEDMSGRIHIILGRNPDGSVKYLDRLGFVSDFLEWFGADSVPADVEAFLNNEKSLKDIAIDAVKSPINKVAQAVTPLVKWPTELAFGKQAYPDVFKPGTIRDKGEYIARAGNVQREYTAISGKPSRPYKETVADLYSNRVNPEEAAYYGILDKKQAHLEKIGRGGTFDVSSARTDMLYYYKRALALGDKEAAQKYWTQYRDASRKAGKNPWDGLRSSIKNAHPLNGLPASERGKFVASLSKGEKQGLAKAMKYYTRLKNTPMPRR